MNVQSKAGGLTPGVLSIWPQCLVKLVEMQMSCVEPLEIFQNKCMTFGGTPLFVFQMVAIEICVPFAKNFHS